MASAPKLLKSRSDIWVYDRQSGERVRETVLGDALLRLAYLSAGRMACRVFLFRWGLVSRILGWYCNTRLSRRKIVRTVRVLGINPDEFEKDIDSFPTFNAFFTRRLKAGARPFNAASGVLVSPADARLLVFPKLVADTCVPVKGLPFSIPALLAARNETADRFTNGAAAVARLSPADYHRYHYPAGGFVRDSWSVSGRYHSVNPIVHALRLGVFTENKREVSILELERFGCCAFIEVGAFGVGAIVQTHGDRTFSKMQEKGFFAFGGSTIILLFESGCVTFDSDLIENSCAGCETLVKAGETIGQARE